VAQREFRHCIKLGGNDGTRKLLPSQGIGVGKMLPVP